MPRNGAGVYSLPAGTIQVTLTPIDSADYNAFVNDIAADMNTPRPVVAGGTGTTSAVLVGEMLTAAGVIFPEMAAPATPVSGKGVIYADTSGFLRHINDAGVNTIISPRTAGIIIPEQAAPATPGSGFGVLYVDTSGRLRYIDDAGLNTLVTPNGWTQPLQSTGTIAAQVTAFIGTGTASTAEGDVRFKFRKACIVDGFAIVCNTPPAGAATFIYTLRKNGADTALTLTLTGATGEGLTSGNPISFAAGDICALKIVTSSAAAVARHNATLDLLPV